MRNRQQNAHYGNCVQMFALCVWCILLSSTIATNIDQICSIEAIWMSVFLVSNQIVMIRYRCIRLFFASINFAKSFASDVFCVTLDDRHFKWAQLWTRYTRQCIAWNSKLARSTFWISIKRKYESETVLHKMHRKIETNLAWWLNWFGFSGFCSYIRKLLALIGLTTDQ